MWFALFVAHFPCQCVILIMNSNHVMVTSFIETHFGCFSNGNMWTGSGFWVNILLEYLRLGFLGHMTTLWSTLSQTVKLLSKDTISCHIFTSINKSSNSLPSLSTSSKLNFFSYSNSCAGKNLFLCSGNKLLNIKLLPRQ